MKHVPDGHVLTLPDELHAEVHGGGRVLPLASRGRRVDAPFRGYAHALDGDDRVVAQLTPSLTLIARYVRAERQKDVPALARTRMPSWAERLSVISPSASNDAKLSVMTLSKKAT